MSKIIIKQILAILLTTLLLSALSNDNNITGAEIKKTTKALKGAFRKYPSKLLKNIPQKVFLKKLYRQNNYHPLWIKNNKLNQKKYTQLFKQIDNDITINKMGLIYKNYQTLIKIVDSNLTQEKVLHTEIKLSSLYYNFLLHRIYGEIKWKSFGHKLSSLKKRKINATWVKSKPKFNISKIMQEPNIDKSMLKVTPKQFGYQRLLLALKKLQVMKEKSPWKKLPYFKRLALGDKGEIVLKLRARLQASGDYIECNKTNALDDNNLSTKAHFSYCLDTAVKTFQSRHGLKVDGIVGAGTQKALNISIDEKIYKVQLNIDRIKWLPREEQKRFLIVNIPEFMLHYIENGKTKEKLRVIVGDTRHPTPIFSQKISYIVLNPYWKVPEGIVKREIVPAMIKNPNYLKKHGLEAHRTWDENSAKINTSSLYWEDYLYENNKFPYRIMQPPGPKNALGKIKFKFPNRFSVYLHDTPTRYLFNKTVRAFSHGCVRLHKPKKLLKKISTFNSEINMVKANKILKGKRKKFLKVNNKLRIYLLYLTAGMNDKGQIEFRNDIYKYDKYQKRRLR